MPDSRQTQMTGRMEYVTFNTGLGWVGIIGAESGLRRTTLPQPSDREAHRRLGEKTPDAAWSSRRFEDLVRRLQTYFSGGIVDFPDKLDPAGATPFQLEVWRITRLIPCGETRSYQWVAAQLGKPGAARGVGQALSKNPLPIIIPCHRVVKSDGKLGGFGGGLEMKKRLLNLEALVKAGKILPAD